MTSSEEIEAECPKKEGTLAIFCIGSNCGYRKKNVAASLDWLSKILTSFRHSPIYATPDCHGGPRKYLNAVAIGATLLSPKELTRLCKDREMACGRDSAAREAGDVPVDIDLVVYGEDILREKDYRSAFFIQGLHAIEHSHSTTKV